MNPIDASEPPAVHEAGPLSADGVQVCTRCGLILADNRGIEKVTASGGIVSPKAFPIGPVTVIPFGDRGGSRRDARRLPGIPDCAGPSSDSSGGTS